MFFSQSRINPDILQEFCRTWVMLVPSTVVTAVIRKFVEVDDLPFW